MLRRRPVVESVATGIEVVIDGAVATTGDAAVGGGEGSERGTGVGDDVAAAEGGEGIAASGVIGGGAGALDIGPRAEEAIGQGMRPDMLVETVAVPACDGEDRTGGAGEGACIEGEGLAAGDIPGLGADADGQIRRDREVLGREAHIDAPGSQREGIAIGADGDGAGRAQDLEAVPGQGAAEQKSCRPHYRCPRRRYPGNRGRGLRSNWHRR